jgi:uncharacterized alkaline shock family protein YloU
MTIGKDTPYGGIKITLDAVAAVAGKAATECYGVVGLAPRSALRESINDLLKKDDYVKGVYCKGDQKKGYEIGLYIYVAYGVKITEVVSEVQKKVRFDLEKTFSLPFNKVNVYVQDVREMK